MDRSTETRTTRPTLKIRAADPDDRRHDLYGGVCHGQNRGTCCGNSRGLSRASEEVGAYRRIAIAMVADGRGWPWKLLRLNVRGKLPW